MLFQPYLESEQIAFCFWDENASDFASALPDLPEKIRGERIWRALVVLPVEAAEQGKKKQPKWECRKDNPFDFLVNADAEPKPVENQVPLIRLAQMLGGVPIVTPHVTSKMVSVEEQVNAGTRQAHTDTHYELRTVIEEDEAELSALKEQWNALNDRYSTSCVLPSSLYLFKGRITPEIEVPETTDKDLEHRHESDSSMFWYRNSYPAKARFITKNFCRPGNAHYHEDLFNFWMTALTLALNEFPTGTFEAYKLYEASAQIALGDVQDVFSRYYNRLDRILSTAKIKIIEFQRAAQFERESDALPYYEAKIPVTYRHMDDTDLKISGKKLGLVNDRPIEEEPWWYEVAKKSRKALEKLISSVRPVLDRASQTCISISNITEEELIELDEYQFEELEEELTELETDILTFSRSEALPVHKFRRDVEARTAETATRMRKHVSQKLAGAAFGTAVGLYLLCFLPDLIRQAVSDGEYTPILAALAGVLVLTLTTLGVLFYFRSGVRHKIRDYNGTMSAILERLQKSARFFSDYLSKCCTYMRGRSMLQLLTHRALVSQSGIKQMTDHAEQLKEYMQLISSWLSDFNLVPSKSAIYEGIIVFDFDIPPSRNSGYQLSNRGLILDIPSVGGSECKAPYPFVTGFEAVRLPVFEKAHYEGPEDRVLEDADLTPPPKVFNVQSVAGSTRNPDAATTAAAAANAETFPASDDSEAGKE